MAMALPDLRSILLLIFLLLNFPLLSTSLNQDGLFLLAGITNLTVPSGVLSDWDSRSATPCNWTGINCSPSASVVSVSLFNLNLSGELPAAFCRLPALRSLNLPYNYLTSKSGINDILNSCTKLQYLDLSMNLLEGPLPAAVADFPSLLHLDLANNNFAGEIPPAFGTFQKLRVLSLTNNLLTGMIPSFLGELSALKQLNLSYNPFMPGPIPSELGRITGLEVLWLACCQLAGSIPGSLGELHNLTDLDLSSNSLTGTIPPELIAGLRNVVQIELYNNSLSGVIPAGFGKLSKLRNVDISMNSINGSIPSDIFEASKLESLHLYQNRLTGVIPVTIASSRRLTEIRLFSNELAGGLPPELGKNSPLTIIDLSDNLISGDIPRSICDRGALEELLLIDNSFSGRIPDSLGRCRTLERVRLANNWLSGEVPPGLWGLPHLYLLELKNNLLSGIISPSIFGAANLSKLILSDNQLTGIIPAEIGAVTKLYEFSAMNNQLTGPLPVSFGSLSSLGQLNLRNNSLSGELLRGIDSWTRLTELNLANNEFTGEIPSQLGSLPVLNYLDLSNNLLTGEVPMQLQNLKLDQFNVSNNQLSGPLPPLYQSETYKGSFLGNPGLCWGSNGLCPGTKEAAKTHRSFVTLLSTIFIIAGLVLVVGVVWFHGKYRKFRKVKKGADKSKWILTSFHKLGFSEYEILDCLDEDNVIGSGGSGKVYKAILSNGEAVAVKKLWGPLQKNAADATFETEVATLGKIRHKNIVKLWCCCAHKDCKLLVYEYMPNGSLGDVLHSSKAGLLDWSTRYKIAVDAAEGLSYLHHDCVPPLVHRDIKSNNILLDANFVARVADFGVAKPVEDNGNRQQCMSVIAGSCGYIAPEYAYTLRVNEKSDVYSFGVVILELITGKLPIDPEFGEKDLVKWVCSTLDQKGVDHVMDPKLNMFYKEEICKVLNIGLLCTNPLPINRPSMRRVVKMLQEVSAENKQKVEKDGKLSPYYYDDTLEQVSLV